MKFDTEGTYTLQYTATDDCGNTATEERTVEVITYNTVLFTDGTLIINEKKTDRDANVALHGAVTNEYIPFNPNGANDQEKYIFATDLDRPWNDQRASIKSVAIGSAIQPTDLNIWFYNLYVCNSFDLNLLDTSRAVSTGGMFGACRALTSLDVSNFNTSNVTDMSSMFSGCKALTSLDLSNFDTNNVTNMRNMFFECKALTSLDVSSFGTSNVTDMSNMFGTCQALTSLDLRNFNTSKVTNMGNMFGTCVALTSLDVSSFDTSNVTNMNTMFMNCLVLKSLDISNFDTSNVTTMINMFSTCRALITITASANFVTTQVTGSTDSNGMFANCTKLVGGAGTRWSSSNPIDKTYAHIDGGTSNPGYFTAKAA